MQIYALIETSNGIKEEEEVCKNCSKYAKKNSEFVPIAYCYPLKKLARLPDISAKMSSIIILQ